MMMMIVILLGYFAIGGISGFDVEQTHRLDPAIPTVAPHESASADSCIGQCSFNFMDDIRNQIGQEKASSLLQLNFNDFLNSFSNTTFFEKFCNIYHNFQHCSSKCQPGFLHQLLMRSSEIMDQYCVYNFEAIRAKFPCLANMHPDKQCVKTCTPHHSAVTSMANNFKNLALGGDTTSAEKYLAEGCEYITCTLHCDIPSIVQTCDYETAQLVVDLTRNSFNSMEKLALDTNVVSKWPQVCSDIKTYRLPKPSTPPESNNDVIAQNSIQENQNPQHPKMVQAPLINSSSGVLYFLGSIFTMFVLTF
ncbi:unnamed protein product [Caenorhabditis angaria]|uniref:Chondroitin proteoglycan 4 domain-containing protein n=1 Tax=Caenorhabditis angaria TaxID=860376 RepID=A0A9P1J0D9_9PELO|nr:unnamed protein product [Caenorhabditis angaria]